MVVHIIFSHVLLVNRFLAAGVAKAAPKSISNTREPKDVAPFHLLLIFENPNGFEIYKLSSKCIQINANIIYKHLEKYFDPLECECLIRR